MVYNGCDYLSMLGLKLNHVSRGRARGPAGFDAPFNMGSAKGEIE